MTNKSWINTAARVGAITVMGSWAHGVAAQVAAAAPQAKNKAPMLEEVVVSARKVTERLQDAPVAVTTLSGATLEEKGIRDLGEAAKLTPSMKFDSDGDVRAGVSIRGVGGSSDVNAAPGVGMFVDGVYQPSSAYFTVPFFDVERMEVLKGPQGTLYGKNTMGGAINIISREPTDDLGGTLMLEGATGHQKVVNGVINLPFTDDFGNRTSVFYRKTNGLQENKTTGEDASHREDFAARTRFVYDPDNGFKSSLALFYADLRSAPFAYSETNEGLNDPIDNVTKNENGLINSEYQSVNFTNSFELDAATLTSLTSYDKGDVGSFIDADYIARPGLLAGGHLDRGTFAQEIRLADSATNNENFHWLVGAYYSNDRIRSTNQALVNWTPIFGGVKPLSYGERFETGDTHAVFGQATWLVDKFEFVAGLRYDKVVNKNHTTNYDGTPVPTAFRVISLSPLIVVPTAGFIRYTPTELKREVTSEELQPKVSVAYHFTPDVMGYGSISRGFRAGGFNALTAPPEYNTYEPETTINYEGGLKTELLDRRLRLNTALYYTDYTDILQTDITTNGTAQTVVSKNGGEATSYGVELDAAFQVSQDLTVSGGYTYLNIKNAEIPFGQIRREVSGFPEHTFNVQMNYLYPISDDVAIGAHLSANYIGETPMGTETEWRNEHTVVDASLDFTVQTITVSLFGKNIFDEEYYSSYIPATSTISGTSALGLLNQPAQYGVRVSSSF